MKSIPFLSMYNYNQTTVDNTETSSVITMLRRESSLFHYSIIRDQLSLTYTRIEVGISTMDGMLSSWIKVHFLIVMSLNKGLQAYPGKLSIDLYSNVILSQNRYLQATIHVVPFVRNTV